MVLFYFLRCLAENREVFRELGGLEKLVDFLANPDQKDMHINCLNVLSNCLEDTQCLDVSLAIFLAVLARPKRRIELIKCVSSCF